MPTRTCGAMRAGCNVSKNDFHKCNQKVTLTKTQEKAINQGGRIDGPNLTDLCKGHKCDFCKRTW